MIRTRWITVLPAVKFKGKYAISSFSMEFNEINRLNEKKLSFRLEKVLMRKCSD